MVQTVDYKATATKMGILVSLPDKDGFHKTLVGGNKSSWKCDDFTLGTVKDIGSIVVSVNLQFQMLMLLSVLLMTCHGF